MRRHLPRLLAPAAALGITLALLASSCAATGSTTTGAGPEGGGNPPTTEGQGDPNDPERPEVDPVEWTRCDEFDCAEVTVPLDYDEPDGQQITIALLRSSRADPDKKIGSLLVNPGGPGGSGIETATYLTLPGDIADHFDLVGFDPRGVGASTSLDCHSHLQAIYDSDATFSDEEDDDDMEHYLEVSRDFVEECEAEHPDLLPHLGTGNVARDLDQIRQALGDEGLTYLGWSYGTSIGQQYARLFPDRVRAMVLDGVVDPSVQGLEAADMQALGFDRALQNFFDDCDARRCLGTDAESVLTLVRAAAEEEPIPARYADRAAQPGTIDIAVASALYSETMWPMLADALQDALEGDASGMVDLADRYLGRDFDGSYANMFEIYFGVSCIDSDWTDDPQEIFEAGRETGERYRLGEALVNDYVRCALWPVDPDPIEPIPSDIEGLAPIVLISTTGDPATPHENAVAVADSIPDARLITYEGEGHGIFARGVRCVDDAVADYLVDLDLPPSGLTC